MTTLMSVSVFEHPLPEKCPAGHELSRGRFRVGWMTCNCQPALALLERGLPAGHHWLTCKACGDGEGAWRHYDPPHES